MDKKMAPVTNIPTTIAASISRKCRQNGDKCRMWPQRELACCGLPCQGWLTSRPVPNVLARTATGEELKRPASWAFHLAMLQQILLVSAIFSSETRKVPLGPLDNTLLAGEPVCARGRAGTDPGPPRPQGLDHLSACKTASAPSSSVHSQRKTSRPASPIRRPWSEDSGGAPASSSDETAGSQFPTAPSARTGVLSTSILDSTHSGRVPYVRLGSRCPD
jgi:hypothetical protein